MNNKIIIRPIKPDDAEQYVRLHNLVWRDAYNHIFPKQVFDEREERTQDKINQFASWIESNTQQINYAAEIDGVMVGFMNATILSNYEHFKNLGFAELMGLYIHPDYQGQGIGGRFKQIFIDWAKENGAKKFVIGVLKDNLKARKVYEKWGGKLDEYAQPFVKLGVEYDEVFYTFDLD